MTVQADTLQYTADMELKLRWSAYECVAACLAGTEEFQILMISLLGAPATHAATTSQLNGNGDIGPLIMDSLLDWQYARKRKDISRVWFATCIVSALCAEFSGKSACMRLKVKTTYGSGESVPLFTAISSAMLECARDTGGDFRLLSSYLQLIAVILTADAALTTKFLQLPTGMSFMLE